MQTRNVFVNKTAELPQFIIGLLLHIDQVNRQAVQELVNYLRDPVGSVFVLIIHQYIFVFLSYSRMTEALKRQVLSPVHQQSISFTRNLNPVKVSKIPAISPSSKVQITSS